MITRSISLTLATFALVVSAKCFATTAYQVTANLSHNGESFGSQVAVVRSDTQALVELSGPKGYQLGFTVTDLAEDEIRVAATLDSAHGSISPVIVLRPGLPATVSVEDLELTLTVDRVDG